MRSRSQAPPPRGSRQLTAGLLDLGPEAVVSRSRRGRAPRVRRVQAEASRVHRAAGRRGGTRNRRGGCTRRPAHSIGSTAARSACSACTTAISHHHRPGSAHASRRRARASHRQRDPGRLDLTGATSADGCGPPRAGTSTAFGCSTSSSSTPAATATSSGRSSAWSARPGSRDRPASGSSVTTAERSLGSTSASSRSPVIAEVSGRRGHSSDAERAKDARRRNELQHLGLRRARVHHRPGAPTTPPRRRAPSRRHLSA